MGINRHHTQFPRAFHRASYALAELRGDARLIVPMDCSIHEELHQAIELVPAMDTYLAQRALVLYREYGDRGFLRNLDNYQRCIEEAILHPKVSPLQRGVGELAVYAMELQRPYIKAGMVQPHRNLRIVA